MEPFYNDGVNDDVSLREERKGKSAVLTFGRFNPPTSGHELLVNKVLKEAKKRGSTNFIFASHSKDKRKNPLDSKTKTNYMKTFFRNANVMYNPSIRTIFDAIGYLADEGYKNITVVVGGDRVEEFDKTIRPYVNHPDPDKSFDLDSFEVVSAGRRDPDAKDVSGMSASKMRAAATEGDFETFKTGVPSKATDAQARKLFDDLRKAMGVREEVELDEVNIPGYKGWVNPKTGKTRIIQGHTPYHIQMVVKDPRFFGLTEKKIKERLVEKYSNRDDPESAADGHFNEIKRGIRDVDNLVDFMAMEKGWVRFVEGEYGEISGAKKYSTSGNDKELRKVLQLIDEETPLTMKPKTNVSLQHYRLGRYGNVLTDLYGNLEKTGIQNIIKGRKPGDKQTEIGRTMSMFREFMEANRIAKTRKNQDPDTHSDLYTDEDPKGTIHGLGFKDVETAEASVRKIKSSDRTHAHKIQAAIAMEQRAKVMKKTAEAAVYRKFIEQMKKKTKEMNEERKASKPVKVLIFSGYSEENDSNLMKTAKRLKEECKKRNVPCFVAFVPFARSFKNEDGTRTVVNKDGKEFIANRFDTVVIVRGAASAQSGTLDMISSFEKDGFFVINSRDSIEICSDKYRTAVTLTEVGLPTPRTALVTDPEMIEDLHKQVGGKFPVVAKTLTGSKGQGVFIIDSKPSLKSVIDAIQKIDESEEIILQEYIDMKSDMRIIVLDGEVVGVMNRGKVKNDFRSNFSMGAKIKKVSISKEIEELALKAAKTIGCYYCGVDIAVSAKTKKPYIIEVNSSPGSEGIEMATKQNIVGDFIDHILDKDNWMYSPTVVGRRETMSVEGIGPLVGKFDTGNMVVNSIHADEYQIDGDTVTWTHGGKKFTNKVVDILTVLQGAIAHDVEQRPMIELDIEFMGKKYPKRRFTLDDRSQKGTPVLVGVPFMKEFGIIVDPGKTFIKTEKLSEATLTKKEMQLRDKYAEDLKKDATADFKSRYGKNYKDVIFGTATNMAKKKKRTEEETHRGQLEGTPERTLMYRSMTPGQFNDMASTYFNRRTK